MTARPRKFLIKGPKVFDQMASAPTRIREIFFQLLSELAVGPYPDQRPDVAAVRGIASNHRYVAWKDGVEVDYLVMQDQPVIALVGVHWKGDPGGGDNGEPGSGWSWSLAA